MESNNSQGERYGSCWFGVINGGAMERGGPTGTFVFGFGMVGGEGKRQMRERDAKVLFLIQWDFAHFACFCFASTIF